MPRARARRQNSRRRGGEGASCPAGTSAENRFDFRQSSRAERAGGGWAGAVAVGQSSSRLAPRRDCTPIRYRCHRRWPIIIRRTRRLEVYIYLCSPSSLPPPSLAFRARSPRPPPSPRGCCSTLPLPRLRRSLSSVFGGVCPSSSPATPVSPARISRIFRSAFSRAGGGGGEDPFRSCRRITGRIPFPSRRRQVPGLEISIFPYPGFSFPFAILSVPLPTLSSLFFSTAAVVARVICPC